MQIFLIKCATRGSLSPFTCVSLYYSRIIISTIDLSDFACAVYVISLLLCRNVLPAGGGESSASCCVISVTDRVHCCIKSRTYKIKSCSAASKITKTSSVSAIMQHMYTSWNRAPEVTAFDWGILSA